MLWIPVLRGVWGEWLLLRRRKVLGGGRILRKPEGGQRAISGNCGGVRGGVIEPGKVCVDIEATGNLQEGKEYQNYKAWKPFRALGEERAGVPRAGMVAEGFIMYLHAGYL